MLSMLNCRLYPMIPLITWTPSGSRFLITAFFPRHSFSLIPYSYAFLSVRQHISSLSMLLPEVPIAYILSSICPDILPKAMLLVVEVFPFIASPVCPSVNSEPMHIIILPLPCVTPSIWPRIGPLLKNYSTTYFTFPSILLSFQSP